MDPELQAQAARMWEDMVAQGTPKDVATARSTEWLSRRQKAAQFKAEAEQYRQQAGQTVELEPESPMVGGRKAALRSIVSGVTLGGADEFGAAVRALPRLMPGGQSFSEAYAEGRDAFRAGREEFREEHPVASTGLEIAGAAAPAVAAGPVAGSVKAGVGRLLGMGAAEGGVAGALESEGGVAERTRGAATGAGFGLATAGILTGAGRVIGATGRRVLDVIGARPSAESGVTGQLASRLGVSSVAERADDRLAGALPEDVSAIRQTLSDTDRPLTLMDADENIAGVARASRGVQGPAKSEIPAYLARRTAGQEERVLDDAFRLSTADPNASIFETVDDIVERRARNAEDMYGPIRAVEIDNPQIGAFLTRPSFRRAYNAARQIAGDRGSPLPPLDDIVDEAGNLAGPVTLGLLDQVKRGLDDVLAVGSRSPLDAGGLGPEGKSAIRTAKNAFLELLDDAVPEYAAARSAFAGESALLHALDEGRNLFRMRPEEAQRLLRDMGESERAMFVRGGMDALQERVESVAATHDITARRPLSNRTIDRRRLRLLFPSEDAFTEFQRSIAQEAQIARTRNFVTGGSNTAEKLMEMAELAGVNLSTLMSGNVTGMAAQMAGSALRRRSQGFTGALGEAMLPTLTAEGSDAVTALDRLTRLRSEVGQQLSRRESVRAGTGGAVAGSVASQQSNDRRRRDR